MRLSIILGVLSGVSGLAAAAADNWPALSSLAEPDCPVCFNCAAPGMDCTHFGDCNEYSGYCSCPAGFGGPNCSQPVCGSLSKGNRRKTRTPGANSTCICDDGWGGINCNMCERDGACRAMMPEGEEGVCYTGSQLVNENFHMCNVTNRKILDVLAGRVAQVTFGCNRNSTSCDLQLWVDQVESFYCKFQECEFEGTNYNCGQIQCECVPDQLLCGAEGSIDISEWLIKSVHGPGDLNCDDTGRCTFEEPAMNQLIQFVFGDHSIELECDASECLHYSQIPGYEPPKKHRMGTSWAIFVVLGVLTILGLGIQFTRYAQSLLKLGGSGRGNGSKSVRLPVESAVSHVKPVTVAFENIGYSTAEGKNILRGVSGYVPAGHVLAIMGGSGAGKTTLLDVLAAKTKMGTIHGSVTLNGVPFNPSTVSKLRQLIGFVDQSDDGLIPTLTVYEHVVFSALLRLPRSMSSEAKELRALDTLKELGILHLQDQLVGSGLSGGERRRVAIACELVTSPSVLFLDEPTSGLDSFSAYAVVECLVGLAKNSERTVIFTIHQPRSNIVSLFDKLLILAQGCLVFTGNPDQAINHFASIGHEVPANYNLADYLVDLSMKAAQDTAINNQASTSPEAGPSGDFASADQANAPEISRSQINHDEGDDGDEDVLSENSSVEGSYLSGSPPDCLDPEIHTQPLNEDPVRQWQDFAYHRQQISRSAAEAMANSNLSLEPHGLDALVDAFKSSSVGIDLENQLRTSAEQPRTEVEPIKTASFWTQFSLLSERTFTNLYRDPQLVLTHYGISIGLGLICGYLYFQVADDISGFQNRLGLFFFLLAVFGFSTLTSLSLFARERLIFMRERANGYYSPIAFFCAKVLLDILPLRVGPPLVLGSLIYPTVGLATFDWIPVKFMVGLVLFNLAAATIMWVIGILIADYGVAVLCGCMVNLFGILFAGLFLNQTSMPQGTSWLRNLSIYHFAYEALSVNEVRYLDLTENKFGLQIQVPGATILSAFGFDNTAVARDLVGLAAISTISLIVGYVLLARVLIERR